MRSPNYGNRNKNRNPLYSITLLIIGAIIGSIVTLYLFITITGGTATPSEPISAPTLSLDTGVPTLQATAEPVATEVAIEPEAPTREPTAIEPTAEPAPPSPTPQQPQLFRIVSAESEARFSVYETFPEGTAVGRTNQIAGDLIVDFVTPGNSQVGMIRINLRTLQTDDPDRDKSIRCCVLLTAQDRYEFAEFTPTGLLGLPEQVQLGQPITFSVTGDLTVRGTTRSIAFDVALNPVSESELQGFAKTVVNRSDFGILNNDENGFDYHGVVEEVTLEFDFVARAVLE